MRELKRALRQLERAHRRSLTFADRVQRRDPALAERARAEAADVARVIGEYRVLLAHARGSLGAETPLPASSVPASESGGHVPAPNAGPLLPRRDGP
ncbi:hypothetical protein [Microbacterium invictum]|uniref:CHAD domain-containing protein n=1 Tax=Microbacterium invictum TaxID=515415 RepID=A0ABZ0V927_9MICO|nr:hypothetical protein [Microbacterium invictum]WQB69744.1 hypothetical protein T9R20_13725 [Microbacterium invictum]